MKRMLSLCAAALCLTLTLTPTALAADFEPAVPNAKVCYPTAIVRGDDGTELKKIYDLSPEDDPAGIPRSDFRQDGFHYTLTDLLKQELPENESRQHTEHVSIESAKKDMESVLALLPQEREFITDDGLMGTLTLRLDTVQVEPSGYGSSTKQLSVKRSYPNLAEQDTQYIPKSIEDGGRTLTLTDIQWQTAIPPSPPTPAAPPAAMSRATPSRRIIPEPSAGSPSTVSAMSPSLREHPSSPQSLRTYLPRHPLSAGPMC